MSKKSKKIFFIAPQPFFQERGTPLNVRAMVKSLSALGYEIDLLVYPLGKNIDIPGVTIHRCLGISGVNEIPIGPSWRKILLDFLLVFKASWMMLRGDYALVHGIEEGGFIAVLLAKARGIPSIFDMDSFMTEQLADSGFIKNKFILRVFSAIESFFLSRANAIITVCPALTAQAKELAPNTPIFQIEDFPLDQIQIKCTDQNVRKTFGLLDTEKLFVYTGNFETYQGLDLLLVSFSKMLSYNYSSPENLPKLLLVGGEEIQINYYGNLARELRIDSFIHFAGKQPGEKIGAFLSVADVLVSPRTLGCNTPLKIYSYLSTGKPIVATRISSHTQILNDNCAFLAHPTEEDFAKALFAAIDDSPSARLRQTTIAASGKHLVETTYSQEQFTEKLSYVYKLLLNQEYFTSENLEFTTPSLDTISSLEQAKGNELR